MAITKRSGPGRPQLHPLTQKQIQQIYKRLDKGQSAKSIADELGINLNAVIREKRNRA
jgi:DNA-binding NarL/FixJ family response regulator